MAEDARARASEQAGCSRASSAPPRGCASSRPRSAPESAPALSAVLDGGDWRDTPFRVEAVELVGVAREDLADVETFCEVPLDEGWRDTLAAVAAAGAKAKLRCGGARVPTVEEVAAFFVAARDLELRSRPRPGSTTRCAPSASTASSTSSWPALAPRRAPARRSCGPCSPSATRRRCAVPPSSRAGAVRLDRLVLVRRAGRGPAGAGAAATLPLGIFSPPGGAPRVGAREGDRVLDLAAVGPAVLSAASLNGLMAAGPQVWAEVAALDDAPDFGLGDVQLHLPFEVADYVDFYSSLEHATNLGRLFRPDAEPLLPNWRHLPVGYHGRAGTVVPSGTPIVRPSGQAKPPDADAPRFGPSRRLDIELELGP